MNKNYNLNNAPENYTDDELISAYLADPKGRGHVSTAWASYELHDLVLEDPERAWRIIAAFSTKTPSPEIEAAIAAGPLETMLGLYGADLIDRVEQLARSSMEFNRLLSLVWQSEIDSAVWQRIQAVCNPVFLAPNTGQGGAADRTLPRNL